MNRKPAKPQPRTWSNVVEVPEGCGLGEGEEFTATGYARLPSGDITRGCKPGDENCTPALKEPNG